MSKKSGRSSQTPEKGTSSNAGSSDGKDIDLAAWYLVLARLQLKITTQTQWSHPQIQFLKKKRKITANQTAEQMAMN